MEIDQTARRILGALIEKRWTTPEQYPLTMNALVAACNQKSNRDPETQLADFIVEGCLFQLRQAELIMVVERDVGRTTRYSERLSEKLDLSRQDQAILAELMLRGAQTSTELHRRCARMAEFQSPEQVDGILQGMAAKKWTRLLPRETGQRYARWQHLFAPQAELAEATTRIHVIPVDPITETSAGVTVPIEPRAPWADQIASLKADIEALRGEVDELRLRLDHVRP